jgi:hypothetical protein
MYLLNVKNWLIAQKSKAKTAWTIIVFLLGLIGYTVSLNPKDKEGCDCLKCPYKQRILDEEMKVQKAIDNNLDKAPLS